MDGRFGERSADAPHCSDCLRIVGKVAPCGGSLDEHPMRFSALLPSLMILFDAVKTRSFRIKLIGGLGSNSLALQLYTSSRG